MATVLNYSAVTTTAGIFTSDAEKQRAAALAYGAVTATANEETEYNLTFAGLTSLESQVQQRSNTLGINPVFAEMSNLNTVGDDIKINVVGDQADETAAALRILMRSSPTAKKLLSIVAEEAENAGAVFTVKTDDALASGGTVVSGLYRTSDPNSIYLNTSNRKNVLDIMMTIVHESGHALGPTLMDHGTDHDLISKAVAAELRANAGITGAEKEIVTFDGKAVTANEITAAASAAALPPGTVLPAATPAAAPAAPKPVAVAPVATPVATAGVGSVANYMAGMQQLTANNVAIASVGMNTALSVANMNYTMPAVDTSWLTSFANQIGGGTTSTMGMGTTTMPAMNTTLPNLSALPAPSIYNMESIFDTSKMLTMDMFAPKPETTMTPMSTMATPMSTTETPMFTMAPIPMLPMPTMTTPTPAANTTLATPADDTSPIVYTTGAPELEPEDLANVFAPAPEDGHDHVH